MKTHGHPAPLPWLLPALALASVLALGGCGTPLECGPATEDGGGVCIPICRPGTHHPAEGGGCLPDSALCTSGEVWDVDTSACVSARELCAAGTTWVASEQRCMAEEEIRPADQVEGARENDYNLGGYEELWLPAVGRSWTLRGTLSKPAEHDGMLKADLDSWVFRTDGPVLLRIEIVGLGGTAAGFTMNSREGGSSFQHIALGTTGGGVTHDVFVPHAGLFDLTVSDDLNLATDGMGPYVGGDGMGYFVTVTNLPFPEPVPLTFENGVATLEGVWPTQPPTEGSMLGFFSLAVEDVSLLQFDLATEDPAVLPLLAAIQPDGRTSHSDPFHLPFSSLQEGGRSVTLVASYYLDFAAKAVPYHVRVEQKPMELFEGDTGAVEIDQPEYAGSAFVEQTYGFEAAAGEVVSVRLTSSTGRTCMQIWNDLTTDLLGDTGCFLDLPPSYRDDLRFVAPYSGHYLLKFTDWEGRDGMSYIPEHTFTFSASLRRYVPTPVGAADPPWSAEGETLTVRDWERYYLLEPEAGSTTFVDVGVAADFEPVVCFYEANHVGAIRASDYFVSSTGTWESADGAPVIVGISRVDGSAGSFDVGVARTDVVDLGSLAEGPVETTVVLPAGGRRVVLTGTPGWPGVVTAVATPPAGVDLALQAYDSVWAPLGERPADAAGEGGVEQLHRLVPDDLFHVEVVTADGAPVASDVPVTLQLSFSRLVEEREPNDTQAKAQHLEVPAAVEARLGVFSDTESDTSDFFVIDLAAPERLDVETMPLGPTDFGDTVLTVYDASMRVVASADGGGIWEYARIGGLSLEAGTWYVQVTGSGGFDGYYALDVARAQ